MAGDGARGRKQFVNEHGGGKLMMLWTDMALTWDAEAKATVDEYARDVKKLKREFGAAFKKLTELGCAFAAPAGEGGGGGVSRI